MKQLFAAAMIFSAASLLCAQETPKAAVPAPEKKLIACWGFDEGQGTAVADSSGSGYNGKIMNDMRAVQWVDGRKGKALHFECPLKKSDRNTSGAVVIEGFPTDFRNGITVECWVKMDKGADWQQRVYNLLTFAPGNYGPGFILYYNWRYYMFLSGPGGQDASKTKWDVIAPVPDLRDQWIHVCATFDGKKGRVYIDGKLLGETKSEVVYYPQKSKTSALTIGSGWAGAANGFPGIIDEVKIYNYALPASEIVKNAKLDM